ncbi:hypothetical protein [Antrihabitans sp. YC2-6]|uniref:hypothetical protein n=1 Tax=Antrihabitans sp. YC2-6 TaxID=2799498 RepID=UPI0018F33367|nr:hypothetical protein [Antrihabitans sp. YC2-6]MBJ8345471.1 hypothetical protein [Antrihabitans sp. YC2-6]
MPPNRSFLSRIARTAAHGVEQFAGRTLDLLDPEQDAHREDVDAKVAAVQDAQRAALRVRDVDLATRLAEVEQYLREHQRRRDDALVPTNRDRGAANATVEDIRKNLLAHTPRPDPADRA